MSVVTTRALGRSEPVERLAEEYSDSAPAYARHWAPVLRPFTVRLLDELPLESTDRALDVGTGTGALLPRLRERTSDARSLPFPAGTIDVVTLPFVLFHVPRPAEALREARRVFRPGGSLGLTTWSRESPSLPGEELVWRPEVVYGVARLTEGGSP